MFCIDFEAKQMKIRGKNSFVSAGRMWTISLFWRIDHRRIWKMPERPWWRQNTKAIMNMAFCFFFLGFSISATLYRHYYAISDGWRAKIKITTKFKSVLVFLDHFHLIKIKIATIAFHISPRNNNVCIFFLLLLFYFSLFHIKIYVHTV